MNKKRKYSPNNVVERRHKWVWFNSRSDPQLRPLQVVCFVDWQKSRKDDDNESCQDNENHDKECEDAERVLQPQTPVKCRRVQKKRQRERKRTNETCVSQRWVSVQRMNEVYTILIKRKNIK